MSNIARDSQKTDSKIINYNSFFRAIFLASTVEDITFV